MPRDPKAHLKSAASNLPKGNDLSTIIARRAFAFWSFHGLEGSPTSFRQLLSIPLSNYKRNSPIYILPGVIVRFAAYISGQLLGAVIVDAPFGQFLRLLLLLLLISRSVHVIGLVPTLRAFILVLHSRSRPPSLLAERQARHRGAEQNDQQRLPRPHLLVSLNTALDPTVERYRLIPTYPLPPFPPTTTFATFCFLRLIDDWYSTPRGRLPLSSSLLPPLFSPPGSRIKCDRTIGHAIVIKTFRAFRAFQTPSKWKLEGWKTNGSSSLKPREKNYLQPHVR